MFAPQNPGHPKTKEVLLGIGPKLGRARKTSNGILQGNEWVYLLLGSRKSNLHRSGAHNMAIRKDAVAFRLHHLFNTSWSTFSTLPHKWSLFHWTPWVCLFQLASLVHSPHKHLCNPFFTPHARGCARHYLATLSQRVNSLLVMLAYF